MRNSKEMFTLFENIVINDPRIRVLTLEGSRKGFPLNTGKRDKWLFHFLTTEESEQLLACHRLDSLETSWDSLYTSLQLFEAAMKEVYHSLGYTYRNDVEKIRNYIELLKNM